MTDYKRSVFKLWDPANSSNCTLKHTASGTELSSSAGEKLILKSVTQIDDGVSSISDLGVYLSDLTTLQSTNHASQAALLTSQQASISAEVVRAQAAEAVNTSNLTAEVSRAVASETTIANNLATQISSSSTSIASVTASYIAADATLTAAVASEATTARAAEAGLQSQITTLLSGSPESLNQLSELVAAYVAADSSLATLITSLTTRVATVESEIAAHLSESP